MCPRNACAGPGEPGDHTALSGKASPAARGNIKAAETSYVGGRIPFVSLIEAQRNLVELQDRFYEAQAELYRRWAMLERIVGGPAD
jgi:outer membrane protein TolC